MDSSERGHGAVVPNMSLEDFPPDTRFFRLTCDPLVASSVRADRQWAFRDYVWKTWRGSGSNFFICQGIEITKLAARATCHPEDFRLPDGL